MTSPVKFRNWYLRGAAGRTMLICWPLWPALGLPWWHFGFFWLLSTGMMFALHCWGAWAAKAPRRPE